MIRKEKLEAFMYKTKNYSSGKVVGSKIIGNLLKEAKKKGVLMWRQHSNWDKWGNYERHGSHEDDHTHEDNYRGDD